VYGVNAAQVTRPGSVIVDRKVVSVHVAFPSTVVDPKMIGESVIVFFEKDFVW
jgi:hypothetical protein